MAKEKSESQIVKPRNNYKKNILWFFSGIKESYQIIKKHSALKPQQIVETLSEFYTESSEKRTNTRKKPWPEFEFILNEVSNSKLVSNATAWKKKTIMILELGCGDGRFAEYLDQNMNIEFHYVGIDCSHGLIATAKERKYTHNVQFFVGDMMHYLNFLEQQSVDIVISIASIQHLFKEQRQPLWNEVYRVLSYDGLHISVNWSYSERMFKKHWKSILASCFLSLINRRTFSFSDIMIPFKELISNKKYPEDEKMPWDSVNIHFPNKRSSVWKSHKTSYRFYHIFRISELKNYCKRAWFIIYKACFISSVWQMSDTYRQSRNTFIVAKKAI